VHSPCLFSALRSLLPGAYVSPRPSGASFCGTFGLNQSRGVPAAALNLRDAVCGIICTTRAGACTGNRQQNVTPCNSRLNSVYMYTCVCVHRYVSTCTNKASTCIQRAHVYTTGVNSPWQVEARGAREKAEKTRLEEEREKERERERAIGNLVGTNKESITNRMP